MDEEELLELSQLAEDLADQEFGTSNIADTVPANAEPIESSEAIDTNVMESLSDEVSIRFSSALWFEKMTKQVVVLAGLGGIGSWVSILIGRCHPCKIVLYDDDVVEGVNMAGQLYHREDIGKSKVDVCSSLIMKYSHVFDIFEQRRYDENSHMTSNIMICGFDSMASRKFFYEKWKEHVNASFSPEDCLFIDGRLNAEEWQVFCIRGTDEYRMREYESQWLFEDSEVEEAACSYKQTSYCASMIASFMVNLFTNFIANQCNPVIERDLPFITEYSADTMYLKTIQ